MNYHTPAEIAALVCSIGKAKSETPLAKLLLLGILAGVYIGLASHLATRVVSWNTAPSSGSQFLFGAVFTVGLMLVVIAGAELFTGNNMFCMVSSLSGESKWRGLLYNWSVVYIANFIGSIFLVYLVYIGNFWGTYDTASTTYTITTHGTQALSIAQNKLSLTWEQAFCRGILCNWLVCLAVWISIAAKDILGKIWAVFFPTMAFVVSGYEHSIANMFFIPMGLTIAQNAPEAAAAALKTSPTALLSVFNYSTFVTNNLIPVTLGNIVGGGIFVGAFYWLIYLKPNKK